MFIYPRVVERRVIWNKVEQQSQPALSEAVPQSGQCRIASHLGADTISSDRESRARNVVFAQVRQRFLEFLAPLGVRARHAPAGRPDLPNRQEPDPVEADARKAVELAVRNIIERCRPAECARKLRQPHTRVDLVKRGVQRIAHVKPHAGEAGFRLPDLAEHRLLPLLSCRVPAIARPSWSQRSA